MKKIIIVLAAVASTSFIFAGISNPAVFSLQGKFQKNPYYKIIPASELPANIQETINQYLGGMSKVTRATIDDYKYEVETQDGYRAKFKLNGSIIKVESNNQAIPVGILAKLPGNIHTYVKSKYADWKLLEVKIKSSKIELELEKDHLEGELEFNGSGILIKEDIDS
ncbi:hypothetical protein ETU10_03165 [Apibacter muscae]|uniref:PepSY-like domain-containing protein n=1 Tax=Apibacter muscae TaxID=2509004 RepID=UPI0011ADCA5B|nr:PepSY-like domain-containing protein [Apibacter muscae]TWP24257.1 hypothetical protein ETU10_03165 [Apibacter muscae]